MTTTELSAKCREALARRCEGYAVKFAIESGAEPTDENLRERLDRCGRPPRPEEYPGIRRGVFAFRWAQHMRRSMVTVPRQDVLTVVSDDWVMAAEVDAEWADRPELIVGERIELISQLCAVVLRRHGYQVRDWTEGRQ